MLDRFQKRQIWMGAGIFSLAGVAVLGGWLLFQPTPRDILLNVENALESVESGHAVVQIDATTPEMSGSATIEVWGLMGESEDQPGAFRLEVLSMDAPDAEKNATGAIFVSDGTQFWMYDPAENVVITGTREEFAAAMESRGDQFSDEFERPDSAQMEEYLAQMPETPEEAFALLTQYFEVTKAGSEPVAGNPAHRLRFLPIAEQMPAEFTAVGGLGYLWVDKTTGLPVAAEYTGGALGEAIVTVLSYEVNQPLDASLFTFTAPEGAEVKTAVDLLPEPTSLNALPEALTPATLPDGAALVEVTEINGAVVQRFTLAEGGSFTLAQGSGDSNPTAPEADSTLVTVRGVSGQLFLSEDASRGLLTWTEGDVTFWLGGDLTSDQLLAIAESLN